MTDATLSLDGIEPISGTVETGGDYIRFSADTTLDEHQINGPHEGQLSLDGADERVVLESYHAIEGGGCEITLRRITPSAS
ncbi:hypothetical protein [Paracoccus fontiphilus]|uniref:Uncharacterized protein n=1 Tax=Paracoccus fontiphilus TaxID=1815556 RepID=A0ABV7I7R6_9RHOB|nr:hypothetical protein [Paracoccus fontiphilus]